MKGIVLPVPSNQIQVTFIIFFTLQLGTFVIFSCFTLKLKENVGGLLGGGEGAKGMLPLPPFKLFGERGWPPLPTPMPNYDCLLLRYVLIVQIL